MPACNPDLKVEVTASVYSIAVLRFNRKDDDVQDIEAKRHLQSYLWSHTEVVDQGTYRLSDERVVYVIKTTAVEVGEAGTIHNEVSALVRHAAYLAQAQVDRLYSGLHGGRVVGGYDEAVEAAIDAC